MMKPLLAEVQGIVGAAHLLTDAEDMAPYCRDWRGRYSGEALAVVLPATTEEVSAVLAAAFRAGVAIVPQGGNTGLCGGATPGGSQGNELLVCLRRLHRIRALDAENNSMVVEAGCTLAAIQDAAEAMDRLFPLSLASEGSATIGGNLSTNAGGVQVMRYGNARELTLGLEVVLADGQIWNGLRALRKDNTGYDLKHLFIGAEGSLGLITAATLKLFPRPQATASAWLAVTGPAQAVKLLGYLQGRFGNRINAFEIIGRSALDLVLQHIPGSRDPLSGRPDWQVLIDVSGERGLESEMADVLQAAAGLGLMADAALASSVAQAKALWALRESISEAQKIEGISIKHDIAVPLSRIPQFIADAGQRLDAAFPGSRIVCFGHIGDGNLHFNLSRPDARSNLEFVAQTAAVNRIVHDLAHELGGTISAEHGLGQLKRDEIRRYKSPVEMNLMQSIKNALDPLGRMNPGKLL